MFSFLIILLEAFQVVIAAVASIVFLVLAGVTLAGSAAALTVSTPLFIIFSPILVPATLATAVLTTGFTASGILGALAVTLLRRRMGMGRRSLLGTLGSRRAGGGLRGLAGGGNPLANIPGLLGGLPAATGGSTPAAGGAEPAAAGGTPTW